jgi:hypothetical protein
MPQRQRRGNERQSRLQGRQAGAVAAGLGTCLGAPAESLGFMRAVSSSAMHPSGDTCRGARAWAAMILLAAPCWQPTPRPMYGPTASAVVHSSLAQCQFSSTGSRHVAGMWRVTTACGRHVASSGRPAARMRLHVATTHRGASHEAQHKVRQDSNAHPSHDGDVVERSCHH